MREMKRRATEAVILEVLPGAKEDPKLVLGDGAEARVVDGALELRDKDGGLLVRYHDGAACISAARGDLELSAPNGRVRVHSALDVELDAGRDVVARADRRLELSAKRRTSIEGERLELRAERIHLASEAIETVAGHIATTAKRVAHNVERWELTAGRLVETSKTAFRDVSDLLQTRAGRARTLIESVYSLRSRRTVMKSEKDTSIDGRKILLG